MPWYRCHIHFYLGNTGDPVFFQNDSYTFLNVAGLFLYVHCHLVPENAFRFVIKPFIALSIFMALKNQLIFCRSYLTEFPTSRLEMSAVADIFDRDGDGYIDYYEFVAALHPNKDAYKPLTDADKIEDEVHPLF